VITVSGKSSLVFKLPAGKEIVLHVVTAPQETIPRLLNAAAPRSFSPPTTWVELPGISYGVIATPLKSLPAVTSGVVDSVHDQRAAHGTARTSEAAGDRPRCIRLLLRHHGRRHAAQPSSKQIGRETRGVGRSGGLGRSHKRGSVHTTSGLPDDGGVAQLTIRDMRAIHSKAVTIPLMWAKVPHRHVSPKAQLCCRWSLCVYLLRRFRVPLGPRSGGAEVVPLRQVALVGLVPSSGGRSTNLGEGGAASGASG